MLINIKLAYKDILLWYILALTSKQFEVLKKQRVRIFYFKIFSNRYIVKETSLNQGLLFTCYIQHAISNLWYSLICMSVVLSIGFNCLLSEVKWQPGTGCIYMFHVIGQQLHCTCIRINWISFLLVVTVTEKWRKDILISILRKLSLSILFSVLSNN